MKIALILPRTGIYRYGAGAFSKALRYAPLTMPTLAALVPKELAAKVQIYDEGVQNIRKEEIHADLIGLTAITGASKRAYSYADYFRSQGAKVVIGGVHATLLPEEAAQHADAVVCGPAYETWPQLLRDFAAGKLKSLYSAEEQIDFSRIPTTADRAKLRKGGYFTVNSIQAVFGCPNCCEFCVTPQVCRGYQHRPIEDVISELNSLKGRLVAFVDPSPIEDVGYALRLCREMRPLRKIWTSLATTRLLKYPELMDAMAESGCRGLLIGFESLSQETNRTISKGFNRVQDFARLAQELHARGIAIMGCFVHGLDSDDKNCFDRTLEFVHSANIDLPRFTIATPFPGTRFFARLKEEGRILTEEWSLYDAQHVVFRPKKMSIEQLQLGHERVWKEAYRTTSIIKRLACSRSFLPVSILTNLAYRNYALNLPQYHGQRMRLEAAV